MIGYDYFTTLLIEIKFYISYRENSGLNDRLENFKSKYLDTNEILTNKLKKILMIKKKSIN